MMYVYSVELWMCIVYEVSVSTIDTLSKNITADHNIRDVMCFDMDLNLQIGVDLNNFVTSASELVRNLDRSWNIRCWSAPA